MSLFLYICLLFVGVALIGYCVIARTMISTYQAMVFKSKWDKMRFDLFTGGSGVACIVFSIWRINHLFV